MSRFLLSSRQRGFSLIEVLVTVVVLAVGLLGAAALQLGGLRVGQSSFYSAQAAQFATDMADRMRANVNEEAEKYRLAFAEEAPDCSPGTSPAQDCERADWLSRLKALPAGDGAIEVVKGDSCLDFDQVTISVRWDDSRSGGDTERTVVLETLLPRLGGKCL